MIDETTDISNKEQVVICSRHVDENLMGHEGFVGLHVVESTEAASLYGVVIDVLLRLKLSTKKLRAQCYDSASAMAGKCGGLAKMITDDEPREVYIHCYGHVLN